jgi:hypothetical protein
MRVISLLAFVAVASSASAVAQGSQTVAQNYQSRSSPLFSNLFAPASTPSLEPSASQGSLEANLRTEANLRARALLQARPTVAYRCGMALVPVDPSFDAKIRRPVPAGRFTIKRTKPPVCGQ